MRFRRVGIAVLSVVVAAAGSLGSAADVDARRRTAKAPPRVTGYWQCKLGRQTAYLALLPNGFAGLNQLTSRYRIVGRTIQSLQNGRWVSYPFALRKHRKLRKDRLTITMPQGQGTLACRRLGQGREKHLRGMLCSWSGSSSSYGGTSISRSTRVWFDGLGFFTFTRESSFSGTVGSHYSKSGAKVGIYRVVGNKVFFALPTGELGVATVHMRQRSGRITEVKLNRTLFATGLCK